MIEISTPATNSVGSKTLKKGLCDSEELDEGEQAFYAAIKPDLNRLITEPLSQTIEKIKKYSASF